MELFSVLVCLFLIFEPLGLFGIWIRITVERQPGWFQRPIQTQAGLGLRQFKTLVFEGRRVIVAWCQQFDGNGSLAAKTPATGGGVDLQFVPAGATIENPAGFG